MKFTEKMEQEMILAAKAKDKIRLVGPPDVEERSA